MAKPEKSQDSSPATQRFKVVKAFYLGLQLVPVGGDVSLTTAQAGRLAGHLEPQTQAASPAQTIG